MPKITQDEIDMIRTAEFEHLPVFADHDRQGLILARLIERIKQLEQRIKQFEKSTQ